MTRFVRRVGDPYDQSHGKTGSPDIWELDNGDFAIIGYDAPALLDALPDEANCAPHERIVRMPRSRLVGAKADIPDV
jgi:hypothetical protein